MSVKVYSIQSQKLKLIPTQTCTNSFCLLTDKHWITNFIVVMTSTDKSFRSVSRFQLFKIGQVGVEVAKVTNYFWIFQPFMVLGRQTLYSRACPLEPSYHRGNLFSSSYPTGHTPSHSIKDLSLKGFLGSFNKRL